MKVTTCSLATASDIPRVTDMVEGLRAAIGGAVPVDRAWTARTLAGLIAGRDSEVWVSRGGFIAGSLQPTVINPAPVAMEHGWWATDGSGLRLLRCFEAWAAARGAMLIQISTGPQGPDVARLGYRMVEQAWVKDGSIHMAGNHSDVGWCHGSDRQHGSGRYHCDREIRGLDSRLGSAEPAESLASNGDGDDLADR